MTLPPEWPDRSVEWKAARLLEFAAQLGDPTLAAELFEEDRLFGRLARAAIWSAAHGAANTQDRPSDLENRAIELGGASLAQLAGALCEECDADQSGVLTALDENLP